MSKNNLKHHKRPPSEIAISSYVERMLANDIFLQHFINENCDSRIIVQKVEIWPELPLSHYKIDTCVFIEGENNERYALLIESKIHWPKNEQLTEYVDYFKEIYSDYTPIPIHLLLSLENKQIKAAKKACKDKEISYNILYIKDIICLYCNIAIEYNFSFQVAYNLHEYINRGNHIAKETKKLTCEEHYESFLHRSENNGIAELFTHSYKELTEIFHNRAFNNSAVTFKGRIQNSIRTILYLYPYGENEDSIKIGFYPNLLSVFFKITDNEYRVFEDSLKPNKHHPDWIEFNLKSNDRTFFDKLKVWK